jgi:hypothetical protein
LKVASVAVKIAIRATGLSRDPIEEAGGANVYAFVSNDPINTLDKNWLAIYVDNP